MSDSVPAKKAHYGFLDSYRALLALAVVLSHTTSIWFAGKVPSHWTWLQVGHPAVCGFIVLSGFVLMIPVARAGQLRGTYREFMARRAKRILPPYYFFVLLLIGFGAIQMVRHGSSNLTWESAAVHLLLLRDLFPNIDGSAGGILWTVCLEWKLYFLFPLLAGVLLRRGIGAVMAAGLAIAAIWFGLVAALIPPANYEHTAPWFAVLFVLGMVVCKLALSSTTGWKTLGPLLLVGAALLGAAYAAPGDLAPLILTDLGSGFLLAGFLFFTMQETVAQKARQVTVAALNWRPLVFIGAYGYSIYLFHLYCLRLGMKVSRTVAEKANIKGDPAFVLTLVVCVVAVLVGCYLLFLVAERPWLAKKPKPAAVEAHAAP